MPKFRIYNFCAHNGVDDIKQITPKEYKKVKNRDGVSYDFDWLIYTDYEFDTEVEAFEFAKKLARKEPYNNPFCSLTIGIVPDA